MTAVGGSMRHMRFGEGPDFWLTDMVSVRCESWLISSSVGWCLVWIWEMSMVLLLSVVYSDGR